MNEGCDPTARTGRTRSAQSESGAAACPRVARMVLARSKSRVILSSHPPTESMNAWEHERMGCIVLADAAIGSCALGLGAGEGS